MNKKCDSPIFLDSGAFTAHNLGIEIDIQDYIKFIKKHKKNIGVYSNLDVIRKEKETWKNQILMEKEGLAPLPVYHLGDDIKYLKKCLEYDYFCLGGMAAQGTPIKKKMVFLDKCWDIICDTKDRMPITKVHGFSVTTPQLMYRYPWYSVDSTSWVQYGKYGAVCIPKKTLKKFNYSKPPFIIFVSKRSPSINKIGKHFSTLSKIEKKYFLEYIEKIGYTLGKSKIKIVDKEYKLDKNEFLVKKGEKDKIIEIVIEKGISNNNILRDTFNAEYYINLANSVPKWPWPFKKIGGKINII